MPRDSNLHKDEEVKQERIEVSHTYVCEQDDKVDYMDSKHIS